MIKLLPILFMSILLSGEMEVDGDLKVTGTIQSADSLNQRIVELEFIIAQLQAQIALLEAQMSFIGQDLNNADCAGVVGGSAYLDDCYICSGGTSSHVANEEIDVCGICFGDAILENECIQTVTDIDGNTYETIIMNNRRWMAENLRVTHYNDGEEILYISDNEEWVECHDSNCPGAYCNPNNYEGNVETHGRLYNKYTVWHGGICPEGYKLPSNTDIDQLRTALGDEEGIILKDDVHWNGTNEIPQ